MSTFGTAVRFFATLAVVRLSSACGGLTTDADPPTQPSGDGSTATPPSDPASGDAPVPPPIGHGMVFVGPAVDSTKAPYVGANLFRTPPSQSGPTYTFDTCVYEDGNVSSDETMDAKQVSAGTISLRSGKRTANLEFDQSSRSYISPIFSGKGPLTSDQAISVSAAGDTVPAFDATIPVAVPLAFTTSFDDGVSATAAFDLDWAPPASPLAAIVTLTGEKGRVVCNLDPTKGHVTIADDLVRQVAANPVTDKSTGAPVLVLDASANTAATVRAGSYSIDVYHFVDRTWNLALH